MQWLACRERHKLNPSFKKIWEHSSNVIDYNLRILQNLHNKTDKVMWNISYLLFTPTVEGLYSTERGKNLTTVGTNNL